MRPPTLATLPTEPQVLILSAPATIGRFQVRHEIGRGSNGVVYSARDPVLGREVAIKAVPLPPGEQREQIEANFLNEARAAGRLNHPHIVTVFDAGRSGDLAYIAMERLHGRDLHDALASGQRMPLRQVASLMARVADAVHYAHKRGLIHRDIKPSNIFLQRDGKPKVLDFGVALPMAAAASSGQKRQLIGTPNYMSPEQALGQALDARSDVFSLGAILYELIGGQRAFDGRSIEQTLGEVIAAAPAPLEQVRPDTPPALLAIVRRALARDPGDRYQTAGELRNDLATYVGGATMGLARSPGPGTRGRALRQRLQQPGARLAVAAIVASAALVTTALVTQRAAELRDAPRLAEVTPVPVVPVAPAAVPAPAPPPEDPTAAAAKAAAAAAAPPAPQPARRARDARTGAAAAGQATADGYVALAISPWGEVLINGATRGVSPPLTRIALPPGTHAVEVRNGAAPPLTAKIEVRPGQTVAVKHRF